MLQKDTTMVPLRFITDYLDAEVYWDSKTDIVNFIIDNDELKERAEQVSRSYAPRSKYPNAVNKKVVVDAGHGGTEVGATYGGIYEKDINLTIAKYVRAELEKNGVRVYMTRTTDVTTSLSSRTTLANSINADLFVSIHNNAMTNKSSIKGTEVLYPTSTIVKNGISAYSLAVKLQNTVSGLAGTYNKGVINRNNLYVLNHTKMPAVIVEVAYMTNYSDLRKLKDKEFLEKAGRAIAQGILESF
jgi:N-acetylmuramoyl-L-alanine amidase